ncbi:DUF5107 domain-containing protein [Bifidobacterium eulemuris]|uniref:DUF5107 domain-containing protein n=1 Tax=Bifidobacterium eulemuris TaxID=1765219 RepID=A0A261FY09_9BIFI|nr:DUF5107 domain-containing protein [Bifidobacterium eulemuris]OZG64071.1 Tetratricopeptide repeat [Bifidobacterium eulemuris]QOL32576.1 DUF5107 domain-containing protein [Bifidobacterium eulemuris]
MNESGTVICETERMTIPTYIPPKPEDMPMFSEFRQHQGSTGYAYPNKATIGVERDAKTDVDYDVVRLENDYIRLLVIPALGGKILEGYDKTTDYHFIYRQSVIKPVSVGSYGSWLAGGMEFNYPFHHRPSTFMPVDFTVEHGEDGSVTVWQSESSPSPGQYRMKGTWGIRLTPDASYFETIAKLDNRTPLRKPFMWWENCGVHVNDGYQLFFPQDVGWVHHHYDRHHATFPINKGWYAVENFPEATDISRHGNVVKGNSFFSGPSKYDFFGGYDHERDCGTMHIADHHVSPGKKNFRWAQEDLGKAWNANLTDTDGEHAELMAGCYNDDQPDFDYLAPFEIRRFNQFWYPFQGVKAPVFANIHAAVGLDKDAGKARVMGTKTLEGARFQVLDGRNVLVDETVCLKPSQAVEFDAALPQDDLTVRLTASDGTVLVDYTEDKVQVLDIPADNPGIPTPHDASLKTAQDVWLAGEHIDQYRDPAWKGREYYRVALERDPDHLPTLTSLAEDRINVAHYDEALALLNHALEVQGAYNQSPYDGTVNYLKGLALRGLGRFDEAYDVLFKATWSNNVVSPAKALIAAIDGRRGDWELMRRHAREAAAKESEHALARVYEAAALARLDDVSGAVALLREVVDEDRLDHLGRFMLAWLDGGFEADPAAYYDMMYSDPSQTVLDVAFDLIDAGLLREAKAVLEGLIARDLELGAASPAGADGWNALDPMVEYTLAHVCASLGDVDAAAAARRSAAALPLTNTFPYRVEEIGVLREAVAADPSDAQAAYLLGCILYDKTFYAQAADCFRATIALRPGFHPAYRNLAIACFSKLGRRDEALELMRKAVNVDPGNDVLVKETNYVMAKLGVEPSERLRFLLDNMPERPSDNLTWDLADAYNANGEFDKAMDVMLNHEFVAAECQETYQVEAWTFANVCKGRTLLRDGDAAGALERFRAAQTIPPNFRAGWWDTQALYYPRYFEGLALKALGRDEEAKASVARLIPFIHSGYSPYMGPECDVYVAGAYRMLGDETTARKYLSEYVVAWRKDLAAGDVDRKPIVTSLYWSFVPDAAGEHRGEILRALAYSRLYFGDEEGAKALFEDSLKANPDNPKARFELTQLA